MLEILEDIGVRKGFIYAQKSEELFADNPKQFLKRFLAFVGNKSQAIQGNMNMPRFDYSPLIGADMLLSPCTKKNIMGIKV